jgi:DNA-binding response OmpR family regulator
LVWEAVKYLTAFLFTGRINPAQFRLSLCERHTLFMKRILIIEDDNDTLNLLESVFNEQGYEVISYTNKNSIKGIIINRPDVVLLDNRLNDGFGHELCSEIKSNELTREIPVILTSGYSGLEDLARGCNADAFIAKPYDLEALIGLVKLHQKGE